MKKAIIGGMLFICSFSFISAQVQGVIIICPDSAKIPISPYVFGSGDEMTACFSPLSESKPLIEATSPSLLRFGGIGAEYIDWEGDSLAGLFYVDFLDTFILTDSVHFGVDSFLRLCEQVNAMPILTVNMQTADTALARRMVEYTNGDTTTTMGGLRAQRGHPEPYDVTIWSLGNEPDIAGGQWPVPPWGYWTFYRHYGIPFNNWSWQDSSFWTAQDFANLIPGYVTAMEQASPLPLEFIYSISGNPSWLRPVIQPNLDLIDYLDVHYYASFVFDSVADTSDYIEWLSKTDTIFPAEAFVQVFRDSLEAIGASSIELVILEYNAGIIMVPDKLWWNYLTGLFIADCIGHWMHQGLAMAGVYSIHEGNPGSTEFPYFGIVRGDSASRTMPSHVLELYNTYFGDTLVFSFSDHMNAGYGIECWASKRSADGAYVFVVINKTLDTTYVMTMVLDDSIHFYQLYDITNNAPIGAPFNGTTGIENRGTMGVDSVQNGWSYLTYEFAPKSISLFEAWPWGVGKKEVVTTPGIDFDLPAILSRGACVKLPRGSYTLYSMSGRVLRRWREVDHLAIPRVSRGIYFLGNGTGRFKKCIIF
jgi:hypothetical protein